ncbi:uncharacterized protein [Nicotiana sylvestris]|uniref:uncharacterized protein n=1 Tax=Nicotiana sylvestris TaxID=4096 RepID=UPI00388CECA9
MRTKHLHDVDAGGGDKPVEKQLKRKGKELCVDDDFVEYSLKIPSVKKPKVSPSSSKPKKKKPSKKVPKLVHKKILVKGEKLNFSLREFGLITGLNCVNKFSDYGYTSTYVSHLMTTYFSNKQRVEKWHLKNVITNKAWAKDEDAVRLCILYLLEFFVCPSDKDHVSFIDKFMFFLIESGNFESYPWGINTLSRLLNLSDIVLIPMYILMIRGCSLALQVWLYECCSSVSTELATRYFESIPRILRWSATKGQIWLTAIEEKMIKPEWLKFTSITESGEEIGVLNLPDKIQYEDAHGAQSSHVLIDVSPTFEPKDTDCQEDTESVTSKLRKLEKGIEQVDGKLAEFRKTVFEELSSLREFIDVSVNSVMKGDKYEFAGSSSKNNDQQQGENNQQFQFNIGDQVHASTSNTAAISPEHVQAHVDLYPNFQEAAGAYKAAEVSTEHLQAHVEEELEFEGVAEAQQAEAEVSPRGVPVMVEEKPGFQEGAEVEKTDIEDNVPQSPIHGVTVNEVVPEGLSIDKKGPTLDDFELPDNLTQLVMYGETIPDKATPIHPGRTRQPGKHTRSPFTPLYSSGGSTSVGPKFLYLKHPFTTVIGENVDADLIERFTNWLYLRSDKVSKRTKIERIYDKFKSSPPELKYSVVKSDDDVAEYILGYRLLANVAWNVVDYVIMPVNIVENFYWLFLVFDIADRQLYVYDSMVSSNRHNTVESLVDKFSIIIPLYLFCTGFYGKRMTLTSRPQRHTLRNQLQTLSTYSGCDCGVFVAAFAEYVSLGDLAIPKEDLSDIDQHRRRYGALLWDYATKKQEDGSISESEVTGRLVRWKGAPAKNERTRVQRKKK